MRLTLALSGLLIFMFSFSQEENRIELNKDYHILFEPDYISNIDLTHSFYSEFVQEIRTDSVKSIILERSAFIDSSFNSILISINIYSYNCNFRRVFFILSKENGRFFVCKDSITVKIRMEGKNSECVFERDVSFNKNKEIIIEKLDHITGSKNNIRNYESSIEKSYILSIDGFILVGSKEE